MDYPVIARRFTTPGGHRCMFSYRENTNDFNTLQASLNEDEYGLAGLSLTGNAVDIGGYLGSVGIGLAIDHPDLTVFIIEPVPENFDLIRLNITQNDVFDRVYVKLGAVGTGSVRYGFFGSDTLEHHAFVGNITLADGIVGQNRGGVAYDPITLPVLLAELDTISLLKIDCEGGEWLFLDSSFTDRLPLIVGEAHHVDGHTAKDIVGLLPYHDVTLADAGDGTCGFRAVLRA